MLMKLWNKTVHYKAFVVNVSKIYRGILDTFAKMLKLENCYKIVTRATLRKKLVLKIAGKYCNQTCTASAQKFQTHFGISFNYFRESNV